MVRPAVQPHQGRVHRQVVEEVLDIIGEDPSCHEADTTHRDTTNNHQVTTQPHREEPEKAEQEQDEATLEKAMDVS